MKMFTRTELQDLRRSIQTDPVALARDRDLLERLLGQAEYALDCAALLDEAIHFPAEPYGEAESLVARLTNGVNEIWNAWHYRERGSDRATR